MRFTQSDLAISTMWNYKKASCGDELIDQLLALGFARVELNYQVRAQWLPDITKRVRAGDVSVVSVHNVFPKVDDDEHFGTDSLLLGHTDESLRRRAVELCMRGIDHACALGAGAVVFHPTQAALAPEAFDIPMKRLVKEKKTGTPEFAALQSALLRARNAAPHIAQTRRSIGELCDYVVKNALPVRLGMENRAMCQQIPLYSEFDALLSGFEGSPAGVWLDTGHGIMMQELGLQTLPLSHKAKSNLVGMHIHDAADGLDHYAPCTLPGDVLAPFREYIDSAPIRVLELSGRLSADDIARGTAAFVARYGA